ncbi:diguanylate cyclase [Candidatus Halobeggiatoa sp. HSG11]|nr:diguanylate cyclase [Candidatus Halobeggiatoa sp. HSG11]
MEKILIVDDNNSIRKMLCFHLKKVKYEIFEAKDGAEALKQVRDCIPDVILLDVMMHGMSGFEVCKELRSDPKNSIIYIIMLTAMADSSNKITGLDIGADDYLIKPFEIEELLARIRVGIRSCQDKRHAVIDNLTQIYNRYFFDLHIVKEIKLALRYQRQLSLIMLDIDHFKRVNDNFGHDVGDSVLVELAAILNKYCRKNDIPIRWGGEEFIILLPETSIQGAKKFAERIKQTIETHNFTGAGHQTASFGISRLIDDHIMLIKQADDALYEAKENGRNMVVVAQKE